jgi:hypothetical protein
MKLSVQTGYVLLKIICWNLKLIRITAAELHLLVLNGYEFIVQKEERYEAFGQIFGRVRNHCWNWPPYKKRR